MKPAVNKALAVGVLVAVGLAAFLFAFTFFKKGGYSEADSYLVYARFSDATGLTWKSKVQIAGIQVGEVAKISLDKNKALLQIRIDRSVPLHTDACLYKSFPSALLPDALLEVIAGSDAAPLLSSLPEAEREIKCVREATSVQQLLDSMAKIASDVQLVTGDLAKTVQGDQGSLREIVENLARITRQVDQVVAQNSANLSELIANTRDFTADLREISARDKDRIHSILANVDELTARLKVAAGSLQGILDGGGSGAPGGGPAGPPGVPGAPGAPGVPGTVGATPAVASQQAQAKGVQQAVARLNDSLSRLDQLLAKVQEGKSVAGRLLTDEKMGRQLGTAVEGVSDYVDRLQKMQIEVQLRSEWLLNQSVEDGRPGAKVYFGAKLLPRPDKYYLLEVVSDPRGVDTVTTDTITTRTPGSVGDSTTVTTRTRHEDKVTFSLQMAKRYGPVTFRGGVIESSGGLGADLHLMKDRLQVSTSLYQFSRPYQDVFPRAKVWANYNFLQHFYVTTGVDDFLNRWRSAASPDGRSFNIGTDVFFGAGLYFTDDDLKTLLVSGAGSAASGAGK
ncbi:Mammalian cell entry related domain protein [Anaeromyxobacter dehalogenans 2CP-1]|uniref:Mammalian cell entry related domain protein n=1 Tax=Anaeromyxobacter dehalogenans (strain ATCC BAA-258 / DSM 21875 / 2CP-1) TaxID=455488 RepID=B8J8C6_ANAD2|nr:MlaD family protein [Anaeromyxobacter dehalogenans]ACL65425.1 Mammalian cell entry related domain protein [Anaeromyxobacter dehalogenans 2CP-1]